MGYYDIDDILADGERIPCKFNLSVPGLGYLEGNPGKGIAKDTKLDLPWWLATVLAVSVILPDTEESFIELLDPDFISSKVLNALHADPTSVDLHMIMGHFYKQTQKWAAMFNETDLIETVMMLLKERALEIDNYANNSTKHVHSNFLYTLDEFEKKLYRATAESKKQMRRWNNH